MYGHNHFSCLVSLCTDFFSFQFQCMINISYILCPRKTRITHWTCSLRKSFAPTSLAYTTPISTVAEKHRNMEEKPKPWFYGQKCSTGTSTYTRKPNFKATLDACARCGNYIYCVNDAPSYHTTTHHVTYALLYKNLFTDNIQRWTWMFKNVNVK